MGWWRCVGRECKLGWGWNQPLDRLISVEGDPLNVTSQAVTEWRYDVYDLSSTIIVYWEFISLLLEPSCKKLLDFQIVFDHNQYWRVECYFSRRREESEKFSKYPSNCSHFISYIYYGVDLKVYFPKTGFPDDDDEKWKHWDNPITALFKDRNLTETQKNTKCRVLINFNEIREITLGELLKFIKELNEGQHSQYDIPVGFEYEKLTQEFRETVVSNQIGFGVFLSYLYSVYRKIEMKMEKAGYPDILPDLDSQEKSFTNICSNLDKAKQEYKSMDRNDLLKMYPVFKKLFFCYTDYITYAIDHEDNIDEGDRLPGTPYEIQPWLQKLNTWVPDITKVEWINCIRCTALINSNEIREMTLGQLLELKKDIQNGKHLDLDAPLSLYLQKLHAEIQGIRISNDNEFTEFISHLYFLYRKIEVKMKEAQYPDIIPDLESKEKSFDMVRNNLDTAKQDYKTMDKNDFLNIYPVLKRLFCSYTNFITYSVDHVTDINESDHLPGTVHEIKSCLNRLNNWVLEKLDGKWINYMKCRVWMNHNEMKEMTSGEILELKRDIEDGKRLDLDIPISFYCHKVNGQIQGIKIKNNDQFTDFISHLYFIYRKIEVKMKEAGYLNILPDLDSEEKSLENIRINLDKTKQDYKLIEKNTSKKNATLRTLFKQTEKNDFLEMYPVIKRLFFCYTDYIKCSIKHELDMDEGDHLPGNEREIQLWLQELNTWTPKKFTGKNINYIGFFIATPPDYDQVVETLRATTKFRDTLIIKDNKAVEPYITDENNKKILFGFVDMKGAKGSETPNDSELFEWECPEECTNQSRTWICTQCGEFVSQKKMILYCPCGSKKYNPKFLICHHPSHRSQGPNKAQNQTFNPDDLLPSICRQLEQIQIRTEGTTDRRILIAVTSFKNNKIQQIETALTNLQGVSLDANTRHMIDLYLNRNH